MNLKKGQYRSQMSQFGWTHMAIFLIVVQSHFIIDNILEGLIWFVLPVVLVACNDTFAYVCGFFWGKTPLIQLSPKKTVEGFVGGFLCTIILGFMVWRNTREKKEKGNFLIFFFFVIGLYFINEI
jgi:phosphatidate cytidylyltransferase